MSILNMYAVCAQTRKISGTISNKESGETLPGATIQIKGTTQGTTSNDDGMYVLEAKIGSTLIVGFSGLEDIEYVVEDSKSTKVVNFELSPEAISLGPINIYGAHKTTGPGTVDVIRIKDLPNDPTRTITNALSGGSGIFVNASDGTLGSKANISIRNMHTISISNSPLWIIDGMPVQSDAISGQDPLSLINQNDIESFVILKDAIATSLYGSRGSNGVILVNTKSGKFNQDKIRTNISYSSGISKIGKNPDRMNFANSSEYFRIVDQAKSNTGMNGFSPQEVTQFFKSNGNDTIISISREDAEKVNSNWFDEVLRLGSTHDLNLSSSGGNKKNHFIIR